MYRPAPPLRAYVDHIWYRRGFLPNRKREYSMPTGSTDLVINLHADRIRVFESGDDQVGSASNGAIVHGPQARAFVLDDVRQVYFAGVHFRPGGGCLLGLPAQQIADRHVSLETLWGVRAIRLRERLLECRTAASVFALLEGELLQHINAVQPVRPAISFALRAFGEGAKLANLSDLRQETGYGERRFRTLFAQAIGLTPKKFMRVLRLRSALHQLAKAHDPLASIAAANGYFDQAHMARDFRELAGVAPSEYKPTPRSPLHMEVRSKAAADVGGREAFAASLPAGKS